MIDPTERDVHVDPDSVLVYAQPGVPALAPAKR